MEQEVEFTLENLQVHVLETHRAPRSDIAAVRIPVDMVRENLLSEREALLRVDPQQLGRFAFPMVQDEYCTCYLYCRSLCTCGED